MTKAVSLQPLTVASGCDPRPVCMRFVVDRVAVGQDVLPVHWFALISTVPPVLHTHSLIYH